MWQISTKPKGKSTAPDPGVMGWFRPDPSSESSKGQPTRVSDDQTAKEPARRYRCARCRLVVASTADEAKVDDRHIHERVNPGGRICRFALFHKAVGLMVTGPPTLDFSWFDGFAWEIGLCARCGVHLGWRWSRDEAQFVGLLVESITLEES